MVGVGKETSTSYEVKLKSRFFCSLANKDVLEEDDKESVWTESKSVLLEDLKDSLSLMILFCIF
jgi:hypothetical protein